MLRTTLTTAVLALSTCTAPAQATQDPCKAAENLAHEVMTARQAGVAASTAFSMAGDNPAPVIEAIVSRAYDVPMRDNPAGKRRAADAYADLWYVVCRRNS